MAEAQWVRYGLIWLVGLALGAGMVFFMHTAHYQPVVEENTALEQEAATLQAQNADLQARVAELEERLSGYEEDYLKLRRWFEDQPDTHPTMEETFPWITRQDSMSRKDLARALSEAWLRAHMGKEVAPFSRLTDYRIESIEILDHVPEGIDMVFQFRVVVSVEPFIMSDIWAAGSGDGPVDGWIVNKIRDFGVIEEDGKYRIKV